MDNTNPYQTNIRPGFLGDFASREHVADTGIKVDAATFPGEDAVKVTVAVAGAAQNAVAVPVAALTAEIPAGTVLDFGGAKFARLTAKAAAGAVSLAVAALPTALVSGDKAFYKAPGVGRRIAAGRIVGATFAELEAAAAPGMLWGQAVDADEIIHVLAYDITDADTLNDGDILRPGTRLFVNFLPDWATLSAALKAKIYARYDVTVGAPGQEVPAT